MQNFTEPGAAVEYTAPRDVVAGTPVQIGQLVVVPTVSKSSGQRFVGLIAGVITGPKATGESWTEGAYLYWDDANEAFTTAPEGNLGAGVAVAVAAEAATTGIVRLDGIGRVQEET